MKLRFVNLKLYILSHAHHVFVFSFITKRQYCFNYYYFTSSGGPVYVGVGLNITNYLYVVCLGGGFPQGIGRPLLCLVQNVLRWSGCCMHPRVHHFPHDFWSNVFILYLFRPFMIKTKK